MVGKTLSHYRILEEHGRGGMGVVFRALDLTLERTVAIKVLSGANTESAAHRDRFYREARSAARLQDSRIAAIYEIGEAPIEGTTGDPVLFIAMEFVEGEDLSSLIADGPLTSDDAIEVALGVAGALEAAHASGIVHRDIKPGNVKRTADGRIKVLDFGLARPTQAQTLTQAGVTMGTAAYMSPEQASGGPVDGRSDLFSLGVTLYEMLAGRPPFQAQYPQALAYMIVHEEPTLLVEARPGVEEGLANIVSRLLAKDPSERYQSASDVVADLRAVQSGARISTLPGPRRARRAWPAFLGLAVVAAAALGMAAAAGLFSAGDPWPADEQADPRVLLISLPGMVHIENPTITTDRLDLAFEGRRVDEKPAVFAYNARDGQVRFLREGRITRMAFAPGSSRLAVDTPGDGIWMVDLPDGEPRTITSFGWSPRWRDEETLLFSGSPHTGIAADSADIWEVDVASGDLRKVFATRDSGRQFDLAGVLAQSGMAFGTVYGPDASQTGVFTLDPKSGQFRDGQFGTQAGLYAMGYMVMQRPDASLAFRPANPRTGEQTRTWRRFPLEVEREDGWSLSPRGDLMYVEPEGSHRLFLADLETQVMEPVVLSGDWADLPYFHPRFSPDGSLITVYVPEDPGTTRSIVIDRSAGNLVTPFPLGSRFPSFTTQDSLLYTASGTSFIQAADGSEPVRQIIDGVWATESPDGRYLAYERGGMIIRDTVTDEEVSMADLGGRAQVQFRFSPDSRYVVWSLFSETNAISLWIAAVDGSWRRQIGVDRIVPFWSREGDYIYYRDMAATGIDQSMIRRIPVQLRPDFQILGPPETVMWMRGGAQHPTLDPVSGRILISSREAGFGDTAPPKSPQLVHWENWTRLLEEIE
ncbi:MAG: serine/threonine-protein kinase [Rhodothermales bacterium]|nr:serine/threonine-protein kinase [Rhodothermales bacterium]MBO6781474.1 serine/threonine-protein kinase [Rhodothermales bacterium]